MKVTISRRCGTVIAVQRGSPGMRPEGHSAITRGLNPPGGMASRRLASQLSDNKRRCRKQNHGDK